MSGNQTVAHGNSGVTFLVYALRLWPKLLLRLPIKTTNRHKPLAPSLIGGGNHCKCGTCFHTMPAQLFNRIAGLERLKV